MTVDNIGQGWGIQNKENGPQSRPCQTPREMGTGAELQSVRFEREKEINPLESSAPYVKDMFQTLENKTKTNQTNKIPTKIPSYEYILTVSQNSCEDRSTASISRRLMCQPLRCSFHNPETDRSSTCPLLPSTPLPDNSGSKHLGTAGAREEELRWVPGYPQALPG